MKKATALYIFNIAVLVFLVSGSVWYFVLKEETPQVEETQTQEEETSDTEVDDEEDDEGGDMPEGDSVLSKPSSMALHNGYLYVVDYDDQLWKIDKDDTTNRILLGSLPGSGRIAIYDIVSHDGVLYLLSQLEGISDRAKLRRIDIGDVRDSTFVGYLPIDSSVGNIDSIDSHNGNLYIRYYAPAGLYQYSPELWQIDLLDPENITLMGDLPEAISRHASAISYNGGFYLLGNKILWQINLSDPLNSVPIGNFPIGVSRTIISDNGILYTVEITDDLDIEVSQFNLNIDDLENNITLVGNLPSGLINPDYIISHNDALYTVANGDDLWQVDPEDPENSKFVANIPKSLSSLASHNGDLYMVGSGDSFEGTKLLQVDPLDLENITEVGDLPAQGPISFLNEYLYVAGDDGKLWKVDPQDLENSRKVIGDLFEGDLSDGFSSLAPTSITIHNGSLYIKLEGIPEEAYGIGAIPILMQIELNDSENNISIKDVPDLPRDFYVAYTGCHHSIGRCYGLMTSYNGDFYVVDPDSKLWKIEDI